MKRLPLVFVALALCLLANADSLRSQIDAMNKTVQKAMLKRDVAAFTKAVKGGITSDFKYSENGKSMSFDEMVEGMKQGFAAMSKVTVANSKVVSLKEKGNTAATTSKHTMMGITMDAKKKAHKMGFTGTSVETYRKENGKWMMSSMSWKDQKMTFDGKPMPAGARG